MKRPDPDNLWAVMSYEGSWVDSGLNWTMAYLAMLAFAERARTATPARR